MNLRCSNCKRDVNRHTRGRCPACHAFLCRTGRERPYRGDGRRERCLDRSKGCPLIIENPSCVRCRHGMRRAGYKNGRPYFRCYGCGARALAYGRRRISRPYQQVASCWQCRRGLVTAGNRNQYLLCPVCRELIAREGVKAPRRQRAHLASCVGCRRPMHNHTQQRDGAPYFYCSRCKWAAYAYCRRQPVVAETRLLAFVESWVPRDMHREIREEVVTDIVLALLKRRRAGNGYGLSTSGLGPNVVRSYIKAAWRRRGYQHKQISIHDGEFPLSERLAG